MKTVAGSCLQSCTSKLQAAGQSCPAECADCGLGTHDHCGAMFALCTIAIKKYNRERKTWKNIVSVMESILVICFTEMFY